MIDSAPPILWLRAWERRGVAWQIRAACLRDGSLVDALFPAEALNHPRAFDIEAAAKLGVESLSVGIDIEDIAGLSPLLDPTDVLRNVHPRLRESRHAIYVAYAGDIPIYFPASLLIRTLWLWSDWVLPALMTPNSLSMYLGRASEGPDRHVVQAIGGLSASYATDTQLRRLAWLGMSADARSSWGSVLSSAYKQSLSLRFPHARLSAWVWGVRVGGGVLACELLSPHLEFSFPDNGLMVKLGRTVHPCPPAPPFRRRTTHASGNESHALISDTFLDE